LKALSPNGSSALLALDGFARLLTAHVVSVIMVA